MRLTLLAPFAFVLTALAAPVDDCEFLKPLSVLKGAQDFCAQKYPAPTATPIADLPKTNAKRFQEDDERVMRVLGGMPESRQKTFCVCYPAIAEAGNV
jgi:hypothetical protein